MSIGQHARGSLLGPPAAGRFAERCGQAEGEGGASGCGPLRGYSSDILRVSARLRAARGARLTAAGGSVSQRRGSPPGAKSCDRLWWGAAEGSRSCCRGGRRSCCWSYGDGRRSGQAHRYATSVWPWIASVDIIRVATNTYTGGGPGMARSCCEGYSDLGSLY